MTNQEGLLPPSAVDIEKTVIGELMIDKDAYDTVSDLLTVESFYKIEHAKIYKAIQIIDKTGGSIDIMTVSEQLNKNGDLESIGGLFALTKYIEGVSSSSNIESHVRIIIDKYNLREVIRLCDLSRSAAYDNKSDPESVIDRFQSDVLSIDVNTDERGKNIYEYMVEFLNSTSSDTPPSYFIKSPIDKINEMSNGFGGSTLTGIGARPSHGKSSLAMEIADHAAKVEKVPTVFIPLEMKGMSLAVRRIAAETGITTTKLEAGKNSLSAKDWANMEASIEKYKDTDLHIDYAPRLTIGSLRAKIRRFYKKGYRFFIIDYLQLMTLDSHHRGDKNAGYGDISKQLKQISMELDIPIVILLQLNRKVEERPKEKQIPLVSDIRDSGEIEQNLDNLIFLANPQKIGLKKFSVKGKDYSMKNIAICDYAKCRNGQTGIFFIGKSQNQMNWYNVNASDCESDEFGKTAADYASEKESDDQPF